MRDRHPEFKGAPLNQPWARKHRAKRSKKVLGRLALAVLLVVAGAALYEGKAACEQRHGASRVCVD